MSLPQKCRREGCSRPRSRLSVFCDVHHEEELVRVGLKTGPNDPRPLFVRRWAHCVETVNDGSLSANECCSLLLDTLMHASQHGISELTGTWLGNLPIDWVDRLVLYAQRNPHPRLFPPLPETKPQRRQAEEKALSAHQRIIEKGLEILDHRSRIFYLGENAVGRFKEDAIPIRPGTYRYEPYRGLGHLEMVEALRENGSAACWYFSDHHKTTFSVVSWSRDCLIELAHFSAPDVVARIEPD
jgi:hypothetical protein